MADDGSCVQSTKRGDERDGTVRKTAYAICACPSSVKLVRKFGRYHHRADWKTIAPKIVSDAHARL